jgi:hypothetical protein
VELVPDTVSVDVGLLDVVVLVVELLAAPGVSTNWGGLGPSRLSARRLAVAVVVKANETTPVVVTAAVTSASVH